MARDISAAAIAESLKSFGATPVWFVVLNLDSGTERFWSGRGDFSWGGDTYEGTGDLGTIGGIEESTAQHAFEKSRPRSWPPCCSMQWGSWATKWGTSQTKPARR